MAKKGKVRPKVKAKSKVKSRPKVKARVNAKRTKAGKRPVKKTAKKAVKKTPELNLEKIGEITHYFPHVKAAAIMLLKDGMKVGDKIYIKGHTTDFKETVKSIQLDHASIQEGKKGQEIGLLVKSRVRQGDSVYRI